MCDFIQLYSDLTWLCFLNWENIYYLYLQVAKEFEKQDCVSVALSLRSITTETIGDKVAYAKMRTNYFIRKINCKEKYINGDIKL